MPLITSLNCSSRGEKKRASRSIQIKNTPYPLKLVKEKERILDGDIAGQPLFAKLKTPNAVFVEYQSKEKNAILVRYNLDLELVDQQTLRYGEGPNECLIPVILGGDENNIIVFDNMKKKYFSFDRNFKCKNQFSESIFTAPSWIPHGVNYSQQRKAFLVCLARLIPSKTSFAWEYSLCLNQIAGTKLKSNVLFKTTGPNRYQPRKQDMFAHPFHFGLIDNSVFILDVASYRLLKMDLDGKIIMNVKVTNIPKKDFSTQQRGEWIEQMGMNKKNFTFPPALWPACWVMELGKGIAVGRRYDYSQEKRRYIEADYFDKELNFLGKINVPWFPQWNVPGQFNSDVFFQNIGRNVFIIEYRETETDEEYWLTRWRLDDGR